MITLAVSYLIRSGNEPQAENFLRELRAQSRREAGCRTYEVHRSLDEPREFLIFEQYDDLAALEAHRQTTHFIHFGKEGLQTIAERRTATTYEPLA